MRWRGKHTGCLGDVCPICPKLERWAAAGHHHAIAALTGVTPPVGFVPPSAPTKKPCTGCLGVEEWPSAILLTGGIGDVFALEAMMSQEERESLEEIYLASPANSDVEALFRALPNYPKLRRFERLPATPGFYHDRAAVEKVIGRKLPPHVADWSIVKVFPQRRPYIGSSFLTHRLCESPTIGLPYVVIVPHSTWGKWEGRSFTPSDWFATFAQLEAQNLYGVVLCRERLPLPAHDRLIDMQSETSILESIEILKAAHGYIGIDSALSVLAAKLMPANRLTVKSVWEQCYVNAASYFAPRKEFSFLRKEIQWSGNAPSAGIGEI